MGINLDKMRAKLDALHNKGKKESPLAPEDGEQTIQSFQP